MRRGSGRCLPRWSRAVRSGGDGMRLRIVTATRGESPFWRETVDSVAAAVAAGGGARDACDHVVVAPAAWAVREAGRTPGLTMVAERGVGLYAAINQGLRAAPGEWDAFTWINDDDVLRVPEFSRLQEMMARDAGVDVAYGRVAMIDREGRRVGGIPVATRPEDLGALLAGRVIPLAQPGTIIRRRLWERLGGLDETYRFAGDMDFFARALAAGARFGFVAAEVAAFRLVAGQLSKQRDEVAAETARCVRPLAGALGGAAALLRFRLANIGVYAERVRRHGFVSMRGLYDRTQ